MKEEQSKALRLADELTTLTGSPKAKWDTANQAAAELRRLHSVELQRDELLGMLKHIASQASNMKFDAYQFARVAIAKVEGEKQ